MLVLSRKKNESIVINDDITIVVVEIRGDKVRLGVEAPKEVPVHRNEVYEAIRRNQQAGERPAARSRRQRRGVVSHVAIAADLDSSLAVASLRIELAWPLPFWPRLFDRDSTCVAHCVRLAAMAPATFAGLALTLRAVGGTMTGLAVSARTRSARCRRGPVV